MEERLYLTAEDAAKYAGVGVKYVYELLSSNNPPPHLRIGNKRLIQKATWPVYLESLQEVRL